jgi:ligand-binding sensor domain-containing protein
MGLYRFYDGFLRSDWDIQGIILDIVEDKNHAIWIGTTGSLLKIYDCKMQFWGQASKPIPFFNVSDLAVGLDNRIWIIARDGLIYYENNSFQKLNTSTIDFPYSLITSLAIDLDNNLWLASSFGIMAKYDGSNIEIFNDINRDLSGVRVSKIKTDNSGAIWACSNNGLYKFNNSGWDFINTKTSIITSKQSIRIFSDFSDNIWIVDGQNLHLFSKDKIKHYDKNNSKFKGAFSIATDNLGKIWIGHSRGLTSFDGTDWKEYDTLQTILLNRDKEIFNKYKDTLWVKNNYKNYLIDSSYYFTPDYYVTNLTSDNFGNLWFRASSELVKYDGKDWTLYDVFNSRIKSTSISDLACDSDKNLWIGTYTNGVFKFDGNEWIVYDSTNFLKANRINSINIFNDSVFVSTSKGTMLFNDDNWIEVFAGGNIEQFIKDKLGVYWIAGELGLIKIDENVPALYNIENSGLASDYINSIRLDYNGNFWILSNGGINIFNENGINDEERIINFFTSF